MIVHKDTKSVETLSEKPNENFGNYENVFVVDDNSDLGKKILAAMPYFDLILDSQGNLADISVLEKPKPQNTTPTLEDRLLALETAMDFQLGLEVG